MGILHSTAEINVAGRIVPCKCAVNCLLVFFPLPFPWQRDRFISCRYVLGCRSAVMTTHGLDV